jgi:hypothetical protein
MSKNSEAFKTIKIYYERACEGIEDCKNSLTFNPADCEDAYARIARVRERYDEEKKKLLPKESNALSKLIEKDNFIKGLMHIRSVGEHVTKRTDFTIITTRNETITLPAATSAMAMFVSPTVTLKDTKGNIHQICHFDFFKEFQRRGDAAFRRAENP